jgi:hypothetical protein
MLDVQELIRRVATGRGEDPALALATAKVESGFRVDARGDPLPDPRAIGGYCSYGLFQENICGGAGTGFALADLFDPEGATSRFEDRVQRVRATGLVGSPGTIAAAAQRPADAYGYAQRVDELYGAYASGSGTPNSGTAPTVEDACAAIDPGTMTRIRQWLERNAAYGANDPAGTAARLRAAFPGVPTACLQQVTYGKARDAGGPVLPGFPTAAELGAAAADVGGTLLLNGAIVGAVLLLGYMGLRQVVDG